MDRLLALLSGLRYKQIQCNFEAHLLHGSNLLGAVWCHWFKLHFRLPNRYVVLPFILRWRRLILPPFPLRTILSPPPKKKEKCDYLRSDYLLYGNVRPRGCLKKEVVIMLKNLTFLFFCFFVLFWLVFLLGGGGSHVSQGKRRKDTSLPTEYKRGNTENWQPMRRDH